MVLLINVLTVRMNNLNINNFTAIQAVGSAADSGVVGAHRHLHFVEDGFIDVAVVDE